MVISVHNKMLDLSSPQVMGILNVTPDSFFSGSRKQTEAEITNRANEIISEGGSIIDVGAFSTRPGATEVSEEEELRRMRYGLEIVRHEQPDSIVSVDTFRPSVARMAVEEYGADIINDVSGGGDGIFQEVARLKVPYILMSRQPDLASTVSVFLNKLKVLRSLGVDDIILDPGYGFDKDVINGNYALLAVQQQLKDTFHLPLLTGISRKRMVWQLLDSSPEDSLNGTTALNILALERGTDILRVHDVRPAVETVKIFNALWRNSSQ